MKALYSWGLRGSEPFQKRHRCFLKPLSAFGTFTLNYIRLSDFMQIFRCRLMTVAQYTLSINRHFKARAFNSVLILSVVKFTIMTCELPSSVFVTLKQSSPGPRRADASGARAKQLKRRFQAIFTNILKMRR